MIFHQEDDGIDLDSTVMNGIKSLLPLSIADDPNFVAFIECIDARRAFPCRNTIMLPASIIFPSLELSPGIILASDERSIRLEHAFVNLEAYTQSKDCLESSRD